MLRSIIVTDESKTTDLSAADNYIRTQTPYLQASISHADRKASFLLIFVSAMLGGVISLDGIDSLTHNWTEQPFQAVNLFAAGAMAMMVISIILSFIVISLRNSAGSVELVSWSGMTKKFKSRKEFASRFMAIGSEEVISQQLQYIYICSKYCSRKWRYLTMAHYAAFIGAVLGALFLVWSLAR
jgi:hypothetical protein